jgi:hypothetical protein
MYTKLLSLLLLMSPTIIASGQPGPLQPGEFVLAKPSRVVSWQLKRLAPPSALYVTPDDLLVLGAASSQTNETVTVNYRLLRAMDGAIVAGQFVLQVPNTRAVTVHTQSLTEGFLLSCSAKASVARSRGQTFARLFLGSGPYGAGQPSYMLMADYVTTAMAPAHPNGRQLSPTEGPGVTIALSTAPAVGSDFIFIVPANTRWQVLGLQGIFVTGAAVPVRSPSMFTRFLATTPDFIQENQMVANPGTSYRYNWGAGLAAQVDALNESTQPLILGTALTPNAGAIAAVGSRTVGIDPGDQWTTVQLYAIEWLDNV